MMTIDSFLSFQRDPSVPNQKKDTDSPQSKVGQAPDKDAAPVVEYESLDW